MTAAKKTTGAATRRTVGQKQGEGIKSAGTRTGRGQAPAPTPAEKAHEEQESQLAPVTLISGRGGFQLKVGGPLPDGSYEQPWDLTFGKKGFIVADERTVAAVEKVLAGEWSDRTVHGHVFQRNARTARLQIVKHGLELPPIPAWDDLAPDSRVDVALAAGMLKDEVSIKKALRYEHQADERTAHLPKDRRREAEPVTVAKLEALLAAQAAGVTVQGVNPAVAAAASGGGASPLQAGATEL